jgi:pimeloyl-ACP methyl ester carboxylesterase
MGKTKAPDWITTHNDMLDVVTEFIQQALSGERFAIAGGSYGGLFAQGVVSRMMQRVDGVFLFVPSLIGGNTELPSKITLVEDAQLMTQLSPHEAGLISGFSVVQNWRVVDSLRLFGFPALEIADEALLTRLGKGPPMSLDRYSTATSCPAPTLILVGRQDHICGYRDAWKIVEHYPRATFAVLDRAGHGLGGEQETLFLALTGEWLDRVEEYVVVRNSSPAKA